MTISYDVCFTKLFVAQLAAFIRIIFTRFTCSMLAETMETGNVGIENLPLMRGPIRTDDLKRPRRPQHVLSRFKRGKH